MSIIGDIGGAFLGPALDFFGAERQQDFTRQNMEYSQGFNAAEAQKNRDYQTSMSNTAYQRATADMQAAGINPMLAAMHGGASTPPGATGSSGALPGPKYDLGQSFNQSRSVSSAVQLQDEQAALTRAQAAKTQAEKTEVEERTRTYPVNINRTEQEINESITRVENLKQQTRVGVATATQMEAHTNLMRETIAQVKSTVQHLNSTAALNYQQITALSGTIGKTNAETSEIIQRVKANLPELQRQVNELEIMQRRYAEPSQRLSSDAQQSFLGSLDRVIKALRGALGQK